MAKLVSDIQNGMRFKGAEDTITITSGEGLRNLNNMYRRVAVLLPWPELMQEDTSLTTTAATRYNWPNSPVFLDLRLVEIQDGDDNNFYKPFWPAPDMHTLADVRRKPVQSVPDYYFRMTVARVQKIELLPAPKYSGKIIRRTGIVEPEELAGADGLTVFTQNIADDALEHMLAGFYQERDGMSGQAAANFRNAQEIWQRLFGKELVPDELVQRITSPP